MLTLQACTSIASYMSSRVLTCSPESHSWDGQPLNNGTISPWGLMIFVRLETIICLVGLKKQLDQKRGLKWVLTQWSNCAKQARFSPPSNTLGVEVQRPFMGSCLGNFCFGVSLACRCSSHKHALWTSNVLHWSVENNNPSHEGNGSCTLWLEDGLGLLYEMQINSPGNQKRPDPICKLSWYEFKGKLQFNDSIFLNLTQFSKIFFSKLVSRE